MTGMKVNRPSSPTKKKVTLHLCRKLSKSLLFMKILIEFIMNLWIMIEE